MKTALLLSMEVSAGKFATKLLEVLSGLSILRMFPFRQQTVYIKLYPPCVGGKVIVDWYTACCTQTSVGAMAQGGNTGCSTVVMTGLGIEKLSYNVPSIVKALSTKGLAKGAAELQSLYMMIVIAY